MGSVHDSRSNMDASPTRPTITCFETCWLYPQVSSLHSIWMETHIQNVTTSEKIKRRYVLSRSMVSVI